MGKLLSIDVGTERAAADRRELIGRAYQTRLGNLTAKNVLIVLTREMNSRGCARVSAQHVAASSEVALRTVLRMFQVFEGIGLLEREQGQCGRLALQINLEMLGQDLGAEFARAYADASGKDSAA